VRQAWSSWLPVLALFCLQCKFAPPVESGAVSCTNGVCPTGFFCSAARKCCRDNDPAPVCAGGPPRGGAGGGAPAEANQPRTGGVGGADAAGSVEASAPPQEVTQPFAPVDAGGGSGPQRVLEQPFRLMDWEKGCTRAAASANVERWCGLFRGTELWVMNVTAASQRKVACDGTDTACLRLTANAFRSDVAKVFWRAGFEGDLLLYQADPRQLPREQFRGTVFGWRPGWTRGRPLTSQNAMYCEASRIDGSSVACFERIEGRVELRGGRLPLDDTGMPLPLIEGGTQATADIETTDSGDYLVFSSLPSPTDKPSLYMVPAGQAAVPSARVLIANDARLLRVAADGTKVFFLRALDYTKVDGPGTLFRVDLPSGKNVVEMARGMVYASEAARPGFKALVYAHEEIDGKLEALHRVFPDETMPSSSIIVGRSDINAFAVSHDAQFIYLQALEPKLGRPVAKVFSLATQTACTLGPVVPIVDDEGNPVGPLLDRFSPDGKWVYWLKEVPAPAGRETWISATADCKPLAKIGSQSDLPWDAKKIGLLYQDGFTAEAGGTLRRLRNDALSGNSTGDEIFRATDRNFAVIPGESSALLIFTSSALGKEGVYLSKVPY
jgi:hypothetical protein